MALHSHGHYKEIYARTCGEPLFSSVKPWSHTMSMTSSVIYAWSKDSRFGLRVPSFGSGFGFRVQGSGFGFRDPSFGFGFRVPDSRFPVPGFGFQDQGLGIRGPGLGFRARRECAIF